MKSLSLIYIRIQKFLKVPYWIRNFLHLDICRSIQRHRWVEDYCISNSLNKVFIYIMYPYGVFFKYPINLCSVLILLFFQNKSVVRYSRIRNPTIFSSWKHYFLLYAQRMTSLKILKQYSNSKLWEWIKVAFRKTNNRK